MDAALIFLCLIGAFYVFAAYIASRAALSSLFIDQAIAAIAMNKPDAREMAQSYWWLAAAVLLMASGAALLFLLDIAVWLFVASALGQAAYLFVVAPRYFDVDESPDETGRRQTYNAFVIYLAATAFVVWAYSRGKLTPMESVPWPMLAIPAAMVAVHAGYILWHVSNPPARAGGLASFAASEATTEAERAETTRVKVMADYDCHPIWALDEHLYGDISPEALGLSEELARDLKAWADAFSSSLNVEDPASSLWSEDQHRAHEAMARPLAVRLARERPDLMVYVMEPEIGVVEVRAEEDI